MLNRNTLVIWLATAFVGGIVGGLMAVAIIGLDPHPFRSAPPAIAGQVQSEQPCLRYGLNGQRLPGPC